MPEPERTENAIELRDGIAAGKEFLVHNSFEQTACCAEFIITPTST